MECLNQFLGIIFSYKINLHLDHKNLVYAASHSESQILIHWQLILEVFVPNIYHIYGADNLVADILSIIPSITINQDKPRSTRARSLSNELFLTRVEQTVEY